MIRKPKKPTSTLLCRYFLGLFAFCAGTLLRCSLSFFLVLCLLLCLVLGVWVVRKRGKAKGFSGFVNFFSLFAFLENK